MNTLKLAYELSLLDTDGSQVFDVALIDASNGGDTYISAQIVVYRGVVEMFAHKEVEMQDCTITPMSLVEAYGENNTEYTAYMHGMNVLFEIWNGVLNRVEIVA
jgi:hypothetical protein